MEIDHSLVDDQALHFTLKGELADQAALIGILNFLYNHRLFLLSVECLNSGVDLPSNEILEKDSLKPDQQIDGSS